jgi:hypothetical protein
MQWAVSGMKNLEFGSAMRSGPKAAKRCAAGAGLDGVAECQAILGLAEGSGTDTVCLIKFRILYLYLRGISTGDFQEALSALLGKDAPNLSPAVIARLTASCADEYAHWQARDLSARRYVYVWADGVYLQARMEEQARRSWLASRSGCARAPRAGGNCWWM